MALAPAKLEQTFQSLRKEWNTNHAVFESTAVKIHFCAAAVQAATAQVQTNHGTAKAIDGYETELQVFQNVVSESVRVAKELRNLRKQLINQPQPPGDKCSATASTTQLYELLSMQLAQIEQELQIQELALSMFSSVSVNLEKAETILTMIRARYVCVRCARFLYLLSAPVTLSFSLRPFIAGHR